MDDFYFGKLIQDERVRQGISQEELCGGLCEPATLSRIESGKRQPSRDLLIMLLQRLGIVADRYYGLNRFDELGKEDLKLKIRNAGARLEKDRVLELLEELEQQFNCSDTICRGFVLLHRSIAGDYSNEQRLDMLEQAIACTVPKLDLEEINKSLLSLDELTIIMNIANVMGSMERRRDAIAIYSQLLRYTDKHWLSGAEVGIFLPLLTYNYSRMLGHEKRFEEELEVVERGLAACEEYGKSRMLGELLINKSCALYEIGREPEGLENAKMSYYVLKAMNVGNQAERVKQYIINTYGLDMDLVCAVLVQNVKQ